MDSLSGHLRRLRSFLALSVPERGLAVRAIWWLAIARIVIHRVSIARLRQWIDGVGPGRRPTDPLSVRRAVLRAARTLPGSSCLAQSVAAEVLLRAGGQPARLTIGVDGSRTAGAASVDAHAWVESGGVLVAGDGPIDRYRELVRFGTDR